MSTPNTEQPKVSWVYSAAVSVKKITAAATATERFMEFLESQDIGFPTLSGVSSGPGFEKRPYSSREPTDSTATLTVPTIQFPAHVPTTAQEWYLLLGSITDAAPDYIECLDTGIKDAVDLHYEHAGGTNELIIDAVTSYCMAMKWTLRTEKPLIIDESTYECVCIETKEGAFEYHKTDASIKLTTTATEREWSKPFVGIHEMKWDTGGADQTLPVQVAVFTTVSKMGAKTSFDTTTKRRTLIPGDFDKHRVSFWVIADDATQYEDLTGLSKVICTIDTYKADASDYIKFQMTGLHCDKVISRMSLGGGYMLKELQCTYNNLKLLFDDGVNHGAAYNK